MLKQMMESPLGRAMLLDKNRSGGFEGTIDSNFTLERLLCPKEPVIQNQDELAALRLVQLTLLCKYSESTWLGLDNAGTRCESPIERLFLSALIIGSVHRWVPIVIEGVLFPLETIADDPSKLHICPQFEIGEFRVDFLLRYEWHQRICRQEPRRERSLITHNFPLVVECDGHDFHEKTKEQASRDKERDRTLQTCGYPVFRYSGSDIHRDALHCAGEAIDYLREQSFQFQHVP